MMRAVDISVPLAMPEKGIRSHLMRRCREKSLSARGAGSNGFQRMADVAGLGGTLGEAIAMSSNGFQRMADVAGKSPVPKENR